MAWRFLFALMMMGLMMGLPALLLRRLWPVPWARWLGRVYKVGVGVALVAVAGWIGARWTGVPEVERVASTVASVLMVAAWLMATTSLLWGPIGALARRLERRAGLTETPDPERRGLLMGMAAAVPAASALASPVGTAEALSAPVLTPVDIPVRDLPEALDGLKILQLTDIHLGTHIGVDQVEKILETARASAPDLIVLTGDVADDYSRLGPALERVRDFGAPLGAFACIGNHEIYRGRAGAEAIYRQVGVPLLCDEGVVLERGGARLWLAGSDDPARLGQDHRAFLEEAVARAVEACPDDVKTRILLCHRPEGFEAAARRQVTLTLSGHTHGGQVAVAGRSVFEPLLPRSYLLGHYQAGESHLYTSAGLGHWLPFRLGCPCEGALITLRRA